MSETRRSSAVVRIRPDIHKQLARWAKQRGLSMAQVVAALVTDERLREMEARHARKGWRL